MINTELDPDEYLVPMLPNEQPFHVGPFHIGQSYDRVPATQLKCKICGGLEFHVATGTHYTAMRCPTCLWELCIHDG